MAVTGFWPVFKNLKATLDYADNPDKTTAPEYLDEDLYAALRYAENDDIKANICQYWTTASSLWQEKSRQLLPTAL